MEASQLAENFRLPVSLTRLELQYMHDALWAGGNTNINNARSRMSQVFQFQAISFLTMKS
jgi:ABC-type uncharacterized transport system auxiliary subunit